MYEYVDSFIAVYVHSYKYVNMYVCVETLSRIRKRHSIILTWKYFLKHSTKRTYVYLHTIVPLYTLRYKRHVYVCTYTQSYVYFEFIYKCIYV